MSEVASKNSLYVQLQGMHSHSMSFGNGGSSFNLQFPDSSDVKNLFNSFMETINAQNKQIQHLQNSLEKMEADHVLSQEQIIGWTTKCIEDLQDQNHSLLMKLKDTKSTLDNFMYNIQGFEDESDKSTFDEIVIPEFVIPPPVIRTDITRIPTPRTLKPPQPFIHLPNETILESSEDSSPEPNPSTQLSDIPTSSSFRPPSQPSAPHSVRDPLSTTSLPSSSSLSTSPSSHPSPALSIPPSASTSPRPSSNLSPQTQSVHSQSLGSDQSNPNPTQPSSQPSSQPPSRAQSLAPSHPTPLPLNPSLPQLTQSQSTTAQSQSSQGQPASLPNPTQSSQQSPPSSTTSPPDSSIPPPPLNEPLPSASSPPRSASSPTRTRTQSESDPNTANTRPPSRIRSESGAYTDRSSAIRSGRAATHRSSPRIESNNKSMPLDPKERWKWALRKVAIQNRLKMLKVGMSRAKVDKGRSVVERLDRIEDEAFRQSMRLENGLKHLREELLSLVRAESEAQRTRSQGLLDQIASRLDEVVLERDTVLPLPVKASLEEIHIHLSDIAHQTPSTGEIPPAPRLKNNAKLTSLSLFEQARSLRKEVESLKKQVTIQKLDELLKIQTGGSPAIQKANFLSLIRVDGALGAASRECGALSARSSILKLALDDFQSQNNDYLLSRDMNSESLSSKYNEAIQLSSSSQSLLFEITTSLDSLRSLLAAHWAALIRFEIFEREGPDQELSYSLERALLLNKDLDRVSEPQLRTLSSDILHAYQTSNQNQLKKQQQLIQSMTKQPSEEQPKNNEKDETFYNQIEKQMEPFIRNIIEFYFNEDERERDKEREREALLSREKEKELELEIQKLSRVNTARELEPFQGFETVMAESEMTVLPGEEKGKGKDKGLASGQRVRVSAGPYTGRMAMIVQLNVPAPPEARTLQGKEKDPEQSFHKILIEGEAEAQKQTAPGLVMTSSKRRDKAGKGGDPNVSRMQAEITALSMKLESLYKEKLDAEQAQSMLSVKADQMDLERKADVSIVETVEKTVREMASELDSFKHMQEKELKASKNRMEKFLNKAIRTALGQGEDAEPVATITTKAICLSCGQDAAYSTLPMTRHVDSAFSPSREGLGSSEVLRSGFRMPLPKTSSQLNSRSESLTGLSADDHWEDFSSPQDFLPLSDVVHSDRGSLAPIFIPAGELASSSSLPRLGTTKTVRLAPNKEGPVTTESLRPIHRKGFPGKKSNRAATLMGQEKFELPKDLSRSLSSLMSVTSPSPFHSSQLNSYGFR